MFVYIQFNDSSKMSKQLIQKLFLHTKCRNTNYPRSTQQRYSVPDDNVDWEEDFPGYNEHCQYFDSPVLAGKPWADPVLSDFRPKFNALDGVVDRRSHCGEYTVHCGYPLNPYGRTGLRGRGVLGRFGPNHAADPIVTKWKRDGNGEVIMSKKGLPLLEMCIIKRHDCGEWAIPGGMVDPGESVSQTLKREFTEEALNGNNSEELVKVLDEFFSPENGTEIYRNYVDDPRNTDNAWMETVAVNFHDETGMKVGRFKLCAGDDAAHVQWIVLDASLQLYANHKLFIEKVVENRKAHW